MYSLFSNPKKEKQMIPNKKTSTKTLAVTTVSQSISLPDGGGLLLSVFNRGTGDVFIDLTNDANASATVIPSGATAGGMMIAANQPATIVTLTASDTYLAAVGTANATIYLTRGRDM